MCCTRNEGFIFYLLCFFSSTSKGKKKNTHTHTDKNLFADFAGKYFSGSDAPNRLLFSFAQLSLSILSLLSSVPSLLHVALIVDGYSPCPWSQPSPGFLSFSRRKTSLSPKRFEDSLRRSSQCQWAVLSPLSSRRRHTTRTTLSWLGFFA